MDSIGAVSDIKVTVHHAGESAERSVTTGTKAWELFSDEPTVIAARVGGTLRDLAHELADCLWCVLTLADAYDVDLEAAFEAAMTGISASLEQTKSERE